jgi:2-amino-4-hydroxy-6-hydroxymethyldihydropteridine diphosphokinase
MSAAERWYPAYIGLGSNLAKPAQQIEEALGLIAELPMTRLYTVSSMYRSAPFGGIEQPDFVNAVASVLTKLAPIDLLAQLQNVENRQGRERDETRWGPRVLDLDLLVYSGQTISEPGLSVPHPGIGERNFVLLPLEEIAPDLEIPCLGRVASIPVNRDEPNISRIA